MVTNDILLLSVGIQNGETRHGLICPSCGGGKHHDKSFSITLTTDGYVLYNCHRASCGVGGRIPVGTRDYGPPVPDRVYDAPPYPTERLAERPDLAKRIQDLYGIDTEELIECWFPSVYRDMVVLPVYNTTMGEVEGCEFRQLPPYNKEFPKTKSYRPNVPHQWYHYFPGVKAEPVWLVEDWWSAYKIWQEFSEGVHGAISLMGSSLSVDTLMAILASCGADRTYYLALDRDATKKAFDYQRKYQFFVNLKVVPLSKDMKYLNRKEMEELTS